MHGLVRICIKHKQILIPYTLVNPGISCNIRIPNI